MKNNQDNLKVFRKIVRDHNKATGFNYYLPEDTDYSSNYAHPVCNVGPFTLTGQIDTTNNRIYGCSTEIDGIRLYIDNLNTEQLVILSNSDIFKVRLANVKMLKDLQSQLDQQINEITSNIFNDTQSQIERENCYDLVLRTARELHKLGEKYHDKTH